MKRLLLIGVLAACVCCCLAQTTGYYTISPDSADLEPVTAVVGDSAIAAQFIIRRYNMDADRPISLHFSGTDSAFFHLSKHLSTGLVDVVHAWYVPTQAGSHTATLTTTCTAAPDSDIQLLFHATAVAPTGVADIIGHGEQGSAPTHKYLVLKNGMLLLVTAQGTYTFTGQCLTR